MEKLLGHLSISQNIKIMNRLIFTLTAFRVEPRRYVPSNYASVSCA